MVESVRRSGRNTRRAVSYREVDTDDEEDVVVDNDNLLHVTRETIVEEDESEKQDDDDDDEGEEEDNDNEDEYVETRKRSRRSGKQSSVKRRRKSPSLEEREQQLNENIYYTQLASPDVDIGDLALSWLASFEEDSKTAMTDLLNLVLRSAGSLYLFTRKDMGDLDHSTDAIDKLVGLFSNQGKHKYPFKLIPLFRNNVVEFFNQIIINSHENGMLYQYNEDSEMADDQDQQESDKYSLVMESIIVWISGLNSCTVRPLRYISTVILLKILSRLSVIINSVIDILEKSQKQLSKIKKTQKIRAKSITQAIETSQRQKDSISLYLKDIVSACLIHRYRDIDETIRQECIKLLGECMLDYPEFFLQPVYLRYFGWLLADPSSNVKAELTRMLLKIYKKFSQGNLAISNGVSQFTQRYTLQIIKMSLLEEDPTVRIHAISICSELLKIGYLNEQDNLKIVSNLFYIIDGAQSIHISHSNLERLKTELSKFIFIWNEEQTNLKLEKYAAIIESCDSVEFANDPDMSSAFENGKLSVQSCLKYGELLSILRQGIDYYVTEEPDSTIESKLPIAAAFSILQRLPQYQSCWEFLITYLLLDTSNITFTNSSSQVNTSASQELISALDVDESDKTILLSFVHGLLIQSLQGKLKAKDREDAAKNVSKMIQSLPKLQKFLMVSEARMQIFLNFWNTGLSSSDSDLNFFMVFKSLSRLDDYNEISESLLRYFFVFENGAMDSSNAVIKEFDKYFLIILEDYDNSSNSAFINTLTPSLRISVQDLAKDLMYGIADSLENPQDPKISDVSEKDEEMIQQQQLFSSLEDILSLMIKLQKVLNHAALEEVLEQRDPSVATLLTFNVYFKLDFVAIFGRLHDEFIPISFDFSKWLGVALEFNTSCLSWQLESVIEKLSTRDNADNSSLIKDEVRNIVDTQRAIIKRLSSLLDDLEIVMERIHDSSDDATDASDSLKSAFKLKEVITGKLMDVLSLLKVFYLRAKEVKSSVVSIMDSNEIQKYVQGYIPIEMQRSILSVALYYEYKIASLTDVDLDRSIEEGINFYDLISIEVPLLSDELLQNEKDETVRREKLQAKQVEVRKRKSDLQWEYEQEFCVYVFGIFKLMKLAMINDFVFERLRLNSLKLGSVYNKIILLKSDEMKKSSNLEENTITNEMEISHEVDAVAN